MRDLGRHRFCDNTPPYRLGDICVVKSDVPKPPNPVFDENFASSGISGVYQLEDVDAFA
jgi:hypothetical protein